MIFILLFLFFFISMIAFFPLEIKKIRSIIYIILGVVLIVIAGFRDGALYRDYAMYVNMFQDTSDTIVEPAFFFISFFIHNIISDNSIYLFVVFAILGVTFKFLAIRQLTELWFYSVLIYLSNFFILHEMTQIRVGVASGFLLLSIKPIYERNLKYFLIFTFLSFAFHFSALIIFPLWFLNKQPQKKWLLLLVPLGYLVYFFGLNLITVIPIPGIKEKIEIYQVLQDLGGEESMPINVFNLVFLVKIFIYYLLIFKYDLLLTYNKYFPILIKIYCISLISYPVFATIPAFATRISELFGVVEFILLPFVYYIFRPIYFSKIIVIFLGLGFLLVTLFYIRLIAQ